MRKMMPDIDFSLGSAMDVGLASCALFITTSDIIPQSKLLFFLTALLLVIRIVYVMIRIFQTVRRKNSTPSKYDEAGDR